MDNSSAGQNKTNSKVKIFTAIQHSSGLVAVLGLFLAASAYNTGRNPAMVSVGLVMIGLGLIGFLVGWAVSRRSRVQAKKNDSD